MQRGEFKQKIIMRNFFLSILIIGGLFLTDAFSLAATEGTTEKTAGEVFDLSALWSEKLTGGFDLPEIDTVKISETYATSADTALIIGGTNFSFLSSSSSLTMKIGGGILEKRTAGGVRVENPENFSNCQLSTEYDFTSSTGDKYSFILCGQTETFVLSSSDSNIISCAGNSCVTVASGTATITLTPNSRAVFVYGKSLLDGDAYQQIGTLNVQLDPISWNTQVYNVPSGSFGADDSIVISGNETTLRWDIKDANSCSASGDWTGVKSLSGSEATGPILSNKTYQLSCVGLGGTYEKAVNIYLAAAQQPPAVVFSANVQQVRSGEQVTLEWTSTNADACVASQGWGGIKPLLGTEITAPIYLRTEFWLTCVGAAGSTTKIVTIDLDNSPPPMPTMTFTAEKIKIDSGTKVKFFWTSQNATSCVASQDWNGDKTMTGSEEVGPLYFLSNFKLTCLNETGSVEKTISVEVINNNLPTLDFWYESGGVKNPPSVPYSSGYILKWTTTNAISCLASGDWTGAVATSGSSNKNNQTVTKTYNLLCTGASGDNVSKSITVVVDPQLVVVNFVADKYNVSSGEKTVLRWTSTGASSCVASGDWNPSYSLSLNGSWNSPAIYSDKNYYITCYSSTPGVSSVTKLVTVTVDQGAGVPPEITFTATPNPVVYNGKTVLSWSAPGAISCVASGNWSGIRENSGSLTLYGLKADKVFTITCANALASATGTINVSVLVPSLPEITSLTADANPIAYSTGTTVRFTYTTGNATTTCRYRTISLGGEWSSWYNNSSGSIATGALQASKTFEVECYNAIGSDIKQIQIIVGDPPSAPVLNFSASKTAVSYNEAVQLTWSTTNATYCVAFGDWNGTKTLNGSQYTSNLTSNAFYAMTCYGGGGLSVTKGVTILVGNQPPIISFSVDSDFVPYNMPTTLRWTVLSANPQNTICSAEENWSGSDIGLAGSQITEPIKIQKIYKIICSDNTVSPASTSEELIVVNPGSESFVEPLVSFWADNYVADGDGETTLNWSSVGATTCEASQSWSGDKGTSGSEKVSGITESKIFVLKCKSPDGDLAVPITIAASGSATPAASIFFTADQTSNVPINSSVNLRWISKNTKSCVASNTSGITGWGEAKYLAGSQAIGPLNYGDHELSLKCLDGNDREVESKLIISVGKEGTGVGIIFALNEADDMAPDVRSSVGYKVLTGRYMVSYDNRAYLSWTTSNAVSCSLTDDDNMYVVYSGIEASMVDYDLANASSGATVTKARNLTLNCLDNNGISSSAKIKIAPYKYFVCPSSIALLTVGGSDVTLSAYYKESSSSASDELNVFDCDTKMDDNKVLNPAWSINPADQGYFETSESVDDLLLHPISEGIAVVLSAADQGFGSIIATLQIIVVNKIDCWSCDADSHSCTNNPKSSCDEGEFEEQLACQETCRKARVIKYIESGT